MTIVVLVLVWMILPMEKLIPLVKWPAKLHLRLGALSVCFVYWTWRKIQLSPTFPIGMTIATVLLVAVTVVVFKFRVEIEDWIDERQNPD